MKRSVCMQAWSCGLLLLDYGVEAWGARLPRFLSGLSLDPQRLSTTFSGVIDDHIDRFAEIVGEIAWRALRKPAEEHAGYIWLSLQRACEMYAANVGDLPEDMAEELAEYLVAWTEGTVRMLAAGRDEGLWQSIWGRRAA